MGAFSGKVTSASEVRTCAPKCVGVCAPECAGSQCASTWDQSNASVNMELLGRAGPKFSSVGQQRLALLVARLPAGTSVLTRRAMYNVTIRASLTHCFETPNCGRRSGEFQNLLVGALERPIRRFAANRLATNLYELTAHLVT